LDDQQKQSVVTGCVSYIRASTVPGPLPGDLDSYSEWRQRAQTVPEQSEDAEEAWFDLDRLIADRPNDAWEVITLLACECRSEDECATLAAGPLTTFMRRHRVEFAPLIEEELLRNTGFRIAYNWLQ
jgi:DNA-directed RNA polymerase specialized sigma24 family protein